MESIYYSCWILMKLELSCQIFENSSNIKFHPNPSIESRVVTCGRTGMSKWEIRVRVELI